MEEMAEVTVHKVREVMVTFKRTDGEDIDGHEWVVGTEWFDDLSDEMTLTKEVWVRESVEEVVVKPSWWEDEDEGDD